MPPGSRRPRLPAAPRVRRTRPWSVSLLLFLPPFALAEPNIVTVPGEGWHLVVDTPPLTSSDGASQDGRFRYTGVDINNGITFSIHTEPMSEGTNAGCREHYWNKAAANPYIVKESVVQFETEHLHGVTHRSEGEYKGRPFTTVNSHGYFVKNGKCVDLHVSQIPFSEEGLERVETIVRESRVLAQ